jgi:hypothetical protein
MRSSMEYWSQSSSGGGSSPGRMIRAVIVLRLDSALTVEV